MEEQHASLQSPHRAPVTRPMVLRLLAIGAVAAGIGILIGLEIPWFPPAAAKQAHTIDTLYYVLIVATVPIFVLVTTVVLFSVWRFRMRPGEERIGVTGQQFEWSFSYPGYKDAQGQTIVTPVLYMELNKPVVFEIHAVDVIHTFWVPAFRIQEDAVPGITTSFRATPDRLGTFAVVCNQLCGYGHSTMRTTLHIVTRSQFSTFLAEHGYAGPAPTASAASAGPSTRHASKEGSQ